MKVESCRAEMLRACISPAQILRQGSFQATLVGLRTFGRRTHEDEWDEVGVFDYKCASSVCWFVYLFMYLPPSFFNTKKRIFIVWGGPFFLLYALSFCDDKRKKKGLKLELVFKR